MSLAHQRSARLGAVVAALGFWAAAPHAVGVALADNSDSSGAAASPRPGAQAGASAGASASADQAGPRRSRVARSASPAPKAANDGSRLAALSPAGVARRSVAVAPAAPAAATEASPVVDAVASTAPAAPVQAVPTTVATFGAVRGAVPDGVGSRLNWLSGLPGGLIGDFLTGALLVVRRDLAASAVTAGSGTLVVSTLADSGIGSLRQAIIDANVASGADTITFSIAGVIAVGSSALPDIIDSVVIDGTTAPGYAGAPVVRIDYNNTKGLTLGANASNSQILGLSLVDASGAGVTIESSGSILSGDYIGVWGDGVTREGNRGDGVSVTAGANGNTIGVGATDAFVLSNVISGNRGNGITISGGNQNTVQANYIGTDASGSFAIANQGNGIELTASSADNLIGGTATGGNNPTAGDIYTPPQGNLISGNRGNGVLIENGATRNQLSGNFVGTNASGDEAIGNRGDGVAVVNADYNGLVGTTSVLDPFVYYNVLAGNRGNGLRITNSDHTVVHANFFGLAADNVQTVANWGDGLLADGNSQYIDAGGEIPLGNVMSGNWGYGIEIAGTVGGFVSWNNFVGQAAFGTTPTPNHKGGILVTSSNPGFDLSNAYTWNKIRTSLVGGNWGNGITFLGNAHGAEVTDTAFGTDYTIGQIVPNSGNGIYVGGNSSQIAIGGFQPSVEQLDGSFSVHVGGNRGYGIVFADNAHDDTVFDTRVGIGTGPTIETAASIPNGKGGILVGCGTSGIIIGGLRDAVIPGNRYMNEIVGNYGSGVTGRFTSNLQILGNTISGNSGSGVVLNSSTGTVVGGPLKGNVISDNGRYGIYAVGNLNGSTVESSTISGNGSSGVRLTWARGITIGGTGLDEGNRITGNSRWGIYAAGWSRGTTLATNDTANNGWGAVNTTFAWGITT